MKRKKTGSTLPLILIFLAGLSLLLYPTISNYWNSLHQSHAIAVYDQTLSSLDTEKYDQMRRQAQEYNDSLLSRSDEYRLTQELQEQYESLLDITGTGIMGYVDIPCINCKLPIYHGTHETVLQVAVGHLEWTSLPIGGPSTHAVISGHRGLPSAELLTHIDRLEVGNTFYIHVLGEVLEYRVDNIAVVLPNDTSRLRVVAGEDYVTLVTCTPYGINSHRLLVRGSRVAHAGTAATGPLFLADEIQPVSLVYVLPMALVGLGAAVWLTLWLGRLIPRKNRKQNDQPLGETV